MRFSSPSAPLLAALLAALPAGCSRRLGGTDEPGRDDLGVAAAAASGVYCINDVQTDPRTYHIDSPRWVLDAAEGRGSRTLTVTIAGVAEPLISLNLSAKPGADDISSAVGYSLTKFYFVQASSTYTVDAGYYKRVEAYMNYARSTWVVRDAACNVVLGEGTSFKPIGIYFKVLSGFDVPIDGVGVTGVMPDCAGGQCGYAPDPGPAGPTPSGGEEENGEATADGGAGDASAGDAGAGGTGVGDGG